MQEIFSSAFAILMEKISNKPKEENLEVQQKKQTVEKNAEDFDMEKSSAPSENIEQKKEDEGSQSERNAQKDNPDQSAVQKKDKGKPLTPLEKAKLEQQKRIAQKQPESPPKQQQPVQKNGLEERLAAYMGR